MKYLLILTLLMVGCSRKKYSGPYRQCLESRAETYLMPQTIGNMTTLMPMTNVVCDKYSIQEYIRVDKKVYEVQYVYEDR